MANPEVISVRAGEYTCLENGVPKTVGWAEVTVKRDNLPVTAAVTDAAFMGEAVRQATARAIGFNPDHLRPLPKVTSARVWTTEDGVPPYSVESPDGSQSMALAMAVLKAASRTEPAPPATADVDVVPDEHNATPAVTPPVGELITWICEGGEAQIGRPLNE